MQRYNMFNLKHKGLRSTLFDTAMTLQHTSFENREAATETISKVEMVLEDFHHHAEHEDKFVIPVLKTYDAILADEFESEHAMDELLTQSINKLIASYNIAENKEDMIATGYALTMAFNEFIAFNLYHMNKEENRINKILWQHFTDAELVQITQAIIASIPPEVMAVESRKMMLGISNAEIINWLLTVKNNAPEQVFRSLFATAEAVLPQQRLNEVQEGLTEGAMIA